MDLFDYLRGAKLNNFEEIYSVDPTTGPSPFRGMLGMRKKVDNATAAKFSDTNVGLLRNGVYQLWRSDSAIVDEADWVRGRLLFAKTLGGGDFIATTVAATAAQPVGIAIDDLGLAGNYKIIQVLGDAAIKYLAGAATKAVPLVMDPVVFAVAANLAVADVELDATAHTNPLTKRIIGRVIEVPANPAAGAVKRILLDNIAQIYNRGVM